MQPGFVGLGKMGLNMVTRLILVGGSEDICHRLEPIFLTLAPEDGYLRVGANGAGHYVKMTHNAIEYGLMQAYAEGVELLQASDFEIDLQAVAAQRNQFGGHAVKKAGAPAEQVHDA